MHSSSKAINEVTLHCVDVPPIKVNPIRVLKIKRKPLKQLRRFKAHTGTLNNFGTLLAKILHRVENGIPIETPFKSGRFEISFKAHTHVLEIWNVATPMTPLYDPDPEPNPPGSSLAVLLFNKTAAYFESEEFKENIFYDLGITVTESKGGSNDRPVTSPDYVSAGNTKSNRYKCSKWFLRKRYRAIICSSLEEAALNNPYRWRTSLILSRESYLNKTRMHIKNTFKNIQYEVASKMTKIKGNNDGPGGRNETYKIGSRNAVRRTTAVKEVKGGAHPGAHVVKINGREYVRDNPDASKKDNVNRDK